MKKRAIKKREYNDPLWKIARKYRTKKDNGEYNTFREAYIAAIDNIEGDCRDINVKKLENAYYYSKTRNIGANKKVSIPIMITQEMRMRLKGLKYSNNEIRYFTPQQANNIIQKQVVNRNPSLNHGRNQ